jgi:hypothetical protein
MSKKNRVTSFLNKDKLISKGLPFCLFGDIYYRHMSFLKIRGLICIDQPLSFNY